jgi:predicted DNA-binding protein with PD1-like motif
MKHILSNPWHEIIRFDRGEEAVSALTLFVKEKDIRAGWVFAIGSSDSVTLSYYDEKKKEYIRRAFDEFLEVVGVSGNIAWKEKEPMLHLHGSFGRTDYGTVSGHIHTLTAAATVEVFIHKIDGELNRAHDSATGLTLLE